MPPMAAVSEASFEPWGVVLGQSESDIFTNDLEEGVNGSFMKSTEEVE